MELQSNLKFPGLTVAGLWGWTAPDGREYALMGVTDGMLIVDISHPEVPQQIVKIPSPPHVWKEIRTYSHYAYLVTEGGGGVVIVDLSALPSTNLPYHSYVGTGAIPQALNKIHTLHIDEKKGFLYTYSGNPIATMIHDLNADPYNPTYAGVFNSAGYVHDGYVDNDTLYACSIYQGKLSIVDMSDKNTPVILGYTETPVKSPNNTWIMDDRKHVLVSETEDPSYITCYDVSNPSEIKEISRYSYNDLPTNNVQVINNWAVISYIYEGVVIVDYHRPENPVITGHFDTTLDNNEASSWGAFPYFPSGAMISGNVPKLFLTPPPLSAKGELFVFKPEYKRACYFEGKVYNSCTGAPIPDVFVEIIGGDSEFNKQSDSTGAIITGQATPGEFTIKFSKPGLQTHEMVITLTPGEIVNFNLEMSAAAYHTISGHIYNDTGQPMANSMVYFIGQFETFGLPTDENGEYEINCLPQGIYIIAAGEWGNIVSQEENITSSGTLNFTTTKKYYDDFNIERGWTSETATEAGQWTRCEPLPATNAPGEDDPEDLGNFCFVTGNDISQGEPDAVSNGTATLISPLMDLSTMADAKLSFKYWFKKEGLNQPVDYFKVSASNGITDTTIFSSFLLGGWKKVENIQLGDFIQLTNEMRIHFSAIETGGQHHVEAGLDQFLIEPIYTNAPEVISADMVLKVFPNPSTGEFRLDYESSGVQNAVLEVKNTIGQVVLQKSMGINPDYLVVGQHWVPGIYFLTLSNDGKPSKPIKLIKN